MKKLPHIAQPPESELEWFQALISLARYLRTPEGCPWDREQTSGDFARYLLGECEELVEAVELGDDAHMEEELGDALFALLAAAAAAEEEGRFALEGVMRRIHDKMVRRHGHVFGEEKAETPEDVMRIWETAKQKERSGGAGG